jgi:hypothetical protein
MGQPRLPYIIYERREDEQSIIVVINNRAYYQSTGKNSGSRDTYFPFLYILDETVEPDWDLLPELFDFDRAQSTYSKHVHGYIVKLASKYIDHAQIPADDELLDESPQINPRRMPLRSALEDSYRLNPDAPLFSEPLNVTFRQAPRIALEPAPAFSTSDPKLINAWLHLQGVPTAKMIPLTRKGLMNTIMSFSHDQCTVENLRWALNGYKQVRRAEKFSCISTFFGLFDMKDKIDAANKMLSLLTEPTPGKVVTPIHFSVVDIRALRDKDLGKIIQKFERCVPKSFKDIGEISQEVYPLTPAALHG